MIRGGVPVSSDVNTVGLVLAEVRDMGPVTVAEIVAGLGLSQSVVRRRLAALEEAGLVESDNYQRRARVYLAAERAGGAPEAPR